MPSPDRYRIYGHLKTRETMALTTAFVRKGLAADLVEETASLRLALVSRSGREFGPYLRTPDGFILGELHAILNWIETAHPEPAMIPRTPVRRVCAQLLEDWIEFWLPLWPRRSWDGMQAIGNHLDSAGFLLGEAPTRPDWLLAAWLEADVFCRPDLRTHLGEIAPRLLRVGNDLLEAPQLVSSDDAIPISLLSLLSDMASGYHAYLAANQKALKDREEQVFLDLGLGERIFPARPECESRRMEIASEIRGLGIDGRQSVRQILEPTGAWHVLTLPSVIDEVDLSDPRSL